MPKLTLIVWLCVFVWLCDYLIVRLRDCFIGWIFCMHQWDSKLQYMILDTSIILVWPNSLNLPLLCDYVWLSDCVIVWMCYRVNILHAETTFLLWLHAFIHLTYCNWAKLSKLVIVCVIVWLCDCMCVWLCDCNVYMNAFPRSSTSILTPH